MNRKGYTLIEVIVSISMLSIASITLAGSFGTIIHFFKKSNEAKTASNTIYSYIEGSREDDITVNIENVSSIPISYSINGISVSGTLNDYKYKNNDDVNLKYISVKKIIKLASTESYKNLSDLMKCYIALKDTLKNGISELNFEDYNTKISAEIYKQELTSDGKILKVANSFPKFDKDLLPSSMIGDYYIKIFYPWEYNQYGSIIHGEPIIYLSKNNNLNSNEENILVIYDYTEDKWYFQNNSGLTIKTNENSISGSWNDTAETINYFIGKNGNYKYYKNMDEIHEELIDPVFGWKCLDKNAEYDESNPLIADTLWR